MLGWIFLIIIFVHIELIMDYLCLGKLSDLDIETDLAASLDDPNEFLSNLKSKSNDLVSTISFPCGLDAHQTNLNQWPENVWRHLVLVFNRSGMVKSSSCSLYLDGHLVGSKRVSFELSICLFIYNVFILIL